MLGRYASGCGTKRIGNCGVQTESDKITEAAVRAADAAKKSALAADSSAQSATQSAKTAIDARIISFFLLITAIVVAGVTVAAFFLP